MTVRLWNAAGTPGGLASRESAAHIPHFFGLFLPIANLIVFLVR